MPTTARPRTKNKSTRLRALLGMISLPPALAIEIHAPPARLLTSRACEPGFLHELRKMFFVQTLFAENRARFCTKWKNSNLCRLFLPKIGWGSARNWKTAIYAEFFSIARIFFLHKIEKSIFVQKIPTRIGEIFCTK